MPTTDPEAFMHIVRYWDTADTSKRCAVLELHLASPGAMRGRLYEASRPATSELWPTLTLVGTGYSRTTAAKLAKRRGMVRESVQPDEIARVVLGALGDALASPPADLSANMLALHGELVTLPGYREGDDATLDALLTELERRYMDAQPRVAAGEL